MLCRQNVVDQRRLSCAKESRNDRDWHSLGIALCHFLLVVHLFHDDFVSLLPHLIVWAYLQSLPDVFRGLFVSSEFHQCRTPDPQRGRVVVEFFRRGLFVLKSSLEKLQRPTGILTRIGEIRKLEEGDGPVVQDQPGCSANLLQSLGSTVWVFPNLFLLGKPHILNSSCELSQSIRKPSHVEQLLAFRKLLVSLRDVGLNLVFVVAVPMSMGVAMAMTVGIPVFLLAMTMTVGIPVFLVMTVGMTPVFLFALITIFFLVISMAMTMTVTFSVTFLLAVTVSSTLFV
mmetsp:Transcript_34276/g.66776  ORF Transcript_34276/g.66776 Transcript_34276/m.66776 type:complete len:286 (+) Transcript_34276:1034-1891(+)